MAQQKDAVNHDSAGALGLGKDDGSRVQPALERVMNGVSKARLQTLRDVRLPTNCKCGRPTCTRTYEVRFTHRERDAINVAIKFYLKFACAVQAMSELWEAL